MGLNLVCANHVFLADPGWNPAWEDQAIDRLHRIGQEKLIFVKKLICANSIEERMQKIHENKRFLSQGIEGTEEKKEDKLQIFKELLY